MMSRLSALAVVVSLLVCGLFLEGTTALSARNVYPTKRDEKPAPVPKSVLEELELWIEFASAANCNVEGWDCGVPCEGDTVGTRVIKYFETKPPFASHGYLAVNDKHKAVILAFRGTKDADAGLSDMDVKLVTYRKFPKAKVHEGFYNINNAMSATLVPMVVDLANKHTDYRIIVTGHSLGGAVSILQTLDIIIKGGIARERLFMYSYASPRVGDAEFANFVEYFVKKGYQLFRAVSKNDVVVQIPPISSGYKHYAPEYWYTQDNTLVKCNEADSLACSRTDVPYSLFSHAVYFGTSLIVSCKNG